MLDGGDLVPPTTEADFFVTHALADDAAFPVTVGDFEAYCRELAAHS